MIWGLVDEDELEGVKDGIIVRMGVVRGEELM